MKPTTPSQLAKDIRDDFWEAYGWSFERIASEIAQLKLSGPDHIQEALSHIDADLNGFQSIERKQDAEFGLRVGLRWMAVLSKLSIPARQERLICDFIRREWIAQGPKEKRSHIIASAVEKYEAQGNPKVTDEEKENLRKDFSKIVSRSD